jgi:hypothetical protein
VEASELLPAHCYLTADAPRVKCNEHGVRKVNVSWAKEESQFTLLFEHVAMTLVREMPVAPAARFVAMTDKRLWRNVEQYVGKSMSKLYLSAVASLGVDETSRLATSM